MLFLAGSLFVWLVVVWRVRVAGRPIILSRRVRAARTSWTTAPLCVGRVRERPVDFMFSSLTDSGLGPGDGFQSDVKTAATPFRGRSSFLALLLSRIKLAPTKPRLRKPR